jgi:hypothetical protein
MLGLNRQGDMMAPFTVNVELHHDDLATQFVPLIRISALFQWQCLAGPIMSLVSDATQLLWCRWSVTKPSAPEVTWYLDTEALHQWRCQARDQHRCQAEILWLSQPHSLES